MSSLVGVFILVMGAGIAGIWTVDIVRSPEVDRARGIVPVTRLRRWARWRTFTP